MKLLLVTNFPGVAATFIPVAEHLKREQKSEVVFLIPEGPRTESEKNLFREFRVIRYPLTRSGLSIFGNLRTLFSLLLIYRSERWDVIHHVTIKPIFMGALLSRLLGLKASVFQWLGLGYLFTEGNEFKRRLLRAVVLPFLKWGLSAKGAHLLCINPTDRDQLISLGISGMKDIELMPGSGTDTKHQFKPFSPSKSGVILYVGRLLKDKGLAELVDAARVLKRDGVSFTMEWVGPLDPENPASLTESEVRTWEKEGILHWLGSHSDMNPFYERAQVVCLPSYREGIPRVLVEASACARAVVATDVPGCREVILPDQSGILVPVKEAVPLAQALKRLLIDPKLCEKMGKEGRSYVSREFDTVVVTERLAQYYLKTLGQH